MSQIRQRGGGGVAAAMTASRSMSFAPVPALSVSLFRRCLLGAALLLACMPALAQQPRPGAVVAMGGAIAETSPMWAEVVRLAGGPGARFVVFTMSSSEPEASAAAMAQRVQRHGATVTHVQVGTAYGDVAAAVRDEKWLALVRGAQGALFAGGDQSLYTAALAPGGQATPLLRAVRELLARGGVVAGSSAGAAIMSRRMFTGGDPLAVMKGTERDGIVAAGLGLIDADVLVDQHFIARGRIGRLLPTLLAEKIPLGLGVEEDSAIVVRGREAEVIGSRGALLVDVRQARRDAGLPEFNVAGAVLGFLEAGDRVDLVTGRVVPSAAKAAGRIVAPPPVDFRPYWRGPVFFPDLLGAGTVVRAMQQLVDSPRAEVRGLAFDALAAADAPQADLGFEWIFSRGADTSAWNVGDAYTVAGVKLEVRPVRMARPLFTPWR
jgi:cyanophycinase